MSTVQEIQLAIANLPEQQRQGLINWLHAQEEADFLADDPELLRQAEKGASELDAEKGISLEEARKMTSKWTSK